MFKVRNKDTRMMSMMSLQVLAYCAPISSVSFVDFEQVYVCWEVERYTDKTNDSDQKRAAKTLNYILGLNRCSFKWQSFF